MARRCGCASDSCSCVVVAGDGMQVTGAGSPRNPYVVTSAITDIETGIDVQVNNVDVARDIHGLDFRGNGVTVTPGTDEVIVTITDTTGSGGGTVDIPTGTIWMFGSMTPPTGWLLCDGRTDLLIADHPDLFAVVGTNFGGDGVTTFGVPNMVDHMPIGASATKPINGLTNHGGAETKTIAVANLPPHTHPINHNHPAFNTSVAGGHEHELRMSKNDSTAATVRRGDGNYDSGTGAVEAGSGKHSHAIDIGNYVGNTSGTSGATATPLNIMPPWQSLAFIIKT